MSHYFYTWTAQKDVRSIQLARASGVRLEDATGAEWIDLGSLSYQASLGFAHPRMERALIDQVRTLAMAPPNADYVGKEELAMELLDLAPAGFSKVFFTLGGAESVENALKIARLVTGRHKTVSRERSYHGATLGALSVTGDFRRAPLEPLLPGTRQVRDCYCDRCPWGLTVDSCARECAAEVSSALAEEGDIGAAIFEPVPGANGVLVPPDDYWGRLREACDRHGTLLIADEVLTGFGRTGAAFAVEHYDVVPDMITVAKAVTAGYAPLGAVLVHDKVAAHFDDHMLYAGLTNYGHPLGVAAAREALAIYRDEKLFERVRADAPAFRQRVESIAEALGERAPFVRAIGWLGIVELDLDDDAMGRLAAALAEERVLTHLYPSRRSVVLAPALTISDGDLDEGVARIRQAIARAL